jgi:uncharacterized protein (DUF488 family)
MTESPIVLTIGHSTHTLAELIDILLSYGVKKIVDIRTIPRSRHNSQFNKEAMPASVSGTGLEYLHIPGLGGFRHPLKDSTNKAWLNDSFRGFADYMQTEDFERNIERLIRLAKKKQVVLMCAESVPWRCHRSLIADALTARGVRVMHIMSHDIATEHKLTAWAKVSGTRVTYP